MLKCKYCNNENIWSCGSSSNGKKRYKCSKCKRTFSIELDKRIKHSLLERKFCITSYLNGMSMRGIQTSLSIVFNKKIHFRNIEYWIKNADKTLQEEIKARQEENKSKEIRVVEMDELFTYIKKNPKILMEKSIVIKEYGLLLIGMQAE